MTVKFDAENIRSMIEAGLLRADLPEKKKGAIREAISKAPGTVLQTITTKLIEKTLDDPMAALKTVALALGITL
ncbi:MAG: hypothetical protein KKE73_09770 [Proteobacteria bacterium]|nr:hypothetical protein [Pseudomonadota bacterium]